MERVQVSFRCLPERREQLKKLAAAAGVSLGDYVETLIDGAASDSSDEERNRRAIRSTLKWVARTKTVDGPFWHRVAHVMGLGSMQAEAVCAEHGFDIQTGLEGGNGGTTPQ